MILEKININPMLICRGEAANYQWRAIGAFFFIIRMEMNVHKIPNILKSLCLARKVE